jgi:predicted dehydrogenase/threonine dehydrogenase-like Zn-dependent dehydrogenase
MKQVCLSSGQMAVLDVPPPLCGPGGVLIRTSHSLISTGTELSTTGGGGGESLIVKAIKNPQLVRKVWEKVGTSGVRQTMELVRSRTSSSLALGYSAAGEVVEVGSDVTGFRAGDRVACAGAGYANHAEFNFVPVNLTARVPDNVSYPEAAFATLGAIALQGVRRLSPTLGEQVVVVGLGLIGQIAAQLLRLSGCRVFGADLLPSRVGLARDLGMDAGLRGPEEDVGAAVDAWTGGVGADGVLVCATGGDLGLLNRSFDLCRRKGRVVLVGDVPIRIARDRIYKKELDFLISCSYGPGRYDRDYEEHGLDYPLPYVRWTEGRNLEEVLRLMGTGGLKVEPLVGRTFPVEQAVDAYQSLQSGERPVAVLLDYGLPERPAAPAERSVAVAVAPRAAKSGRVRLGVIGAGGFFKAVHLPILQKHEGFEVASIASRTGLQLRDLALRHGVPAITTDPEEVLRDPSIEAVLIATRHNLHAPLVLRAIAAGKHVFVEKPLALTTADCDQIVDAVDASGLVLTVGFNRRFSPHAIKAKALLDQSREPKVIVYRVNAGALPPEHWLRDPVEGGGRLVGEGVHFFDFMRWLAGADPVDVVARSVTRNDAPDPDNVAVAVSFADGSLGTLVYVSGGNSALGKERVETSGAGRSIVIDDYRSLEVFGVSGAGQKSRVIEKGHTGILDNFHQAIRGQAPIGITARDGRWATWCAERATAALYAAVPDVAVAPADAAGPPRPDRAPVA